MNTIRTLARRVLMCSCNCAGCVLGTGHCHSVRCGGG